MLTQNFEQSPLFVFTISKCIKRDIKTVNPFSPLYLIGFVKPKKWVITVTSSKAPFCRIECITFDPSYRAWYFAVLLSPQEYRVGFYAIETAVIVAEALWFQGWFRLGWRYSVMVSLITNGVSMILGVCFF